MDIKAYKMDGLGNDFVIIDKRINEANLSKDQIVNIGDRNKKTAVKRAFSSENLIAFL